MTSACFTTFLYWAISGLPCFWRQMSSFMDMVGRMWTNREVWQVLSSCKHNLSWVVGDITRCSVLPNIPLHSRCNTQNFQNVLWVECKVEFSAEVKKVHLGLVCSNRSHCHMWLMEGLFADVNHGRSHLLFSCSLLLNMLIFGTGVGSMESTGVWVVVVVVFLFIEFIFFSLLVLELLCVFYDGLWNDYEIFFLEMGNEKIQYSTYSNASMTCHDIVFLMYSELTGSRRYQTLSVQHLNGIVLIGCQRCVLLSTKSHTCRIGCRVSATGINPAVMKSI